MLREIGALQDNARDISVRMEEMATGVTQINDGAQNVSGLAVSNQDTIQKIAVIVKDFTV
jgi:methyl-accepting chemotaxis protein